MPKKKTTVEPTIIETTDTVIKTGNEQITTTDTKTTFVYSVINSRLTRVE